MKRNNVLLVNLTSAVSAFLHNECECCVIQVMFCNIIVSCQIICELKLWRPSFRFTIPSFLIFIIRNIKTNVKHITVSEIVTKPRKMLVRTQLHFKISWSISKNLRSTKL